MIALDLDGTLLHDDKTLSDFTLAQLRRCQAMGIKVVFATGRSETGASRFFEQFDADGTITSGGAIARAGGKLITSALMPSAVTDGFIARCLQMPGIKHILLAGEHAHLSNDPRATEAVDTTHYAFSDFSALPHQKAYKLTLITADMDAIHQLAREFDSLSFTTYTGEDMHAFASKLAVKEVALEALAKHYGIALEDVAVFGNDMNDLGMIRECGLGVAVGNAIPELIAAADEVCRSNNDDGVGRWIEHNIR